MSLQVELLADSFELVRSQKEAFARSFYRHLFMTYPQTTSLFEHTDMKRQEASLVAALSLVVSLLKKGEQDQLVSVVEALGRRHHGYGVKWEHYWMVGNVLLSTLADCLGQRWTPALNDAWAQAYQALVKLMWSGPVPVEASRGELTAPREEHVRAPVAMEGVA